ncbi:hypothetical protein PR048_024439 [Dryococelus australis]|uniref:HTH CENPB-type domain-containing protein n=1 Tax=Dryococelus australis TaxID=614101 RepID=A0ABQ9GNM3_9NEOP|nr:hypothetical protein PR048_024439 [Dryococelus australis]
MVRNYIKKGVPYSQETIEKAIREVVEQKLGIHTVAKKYNIPKSVLGRKVLHSSPQVERRGWKAVRIAQNEKELAHHLTTLSRWGFPFSKADVKCVVQEYAEQHNLQTPFRGTRPGDDWFRNFSKRNNLSLRKLEVLEKLRR